jgi:hypothetical protein
MAKHMAEGVDYPVFFYGQCYMGSLEPAISALFYKILGHSMFAICLGVLLFALGSLILTYCWGRDIGGPAVGLLALALCVVGPDSFFWFSIAPRGG